MSQMYFLGIDGGGSTLRIAITDANLQAISSYQDSTTNPNIIGHDNSAHHIHNGIQQALLQANLTKQDITAVGVGISGASKFHSEQWLIDTIQPALPHSLLVPSSDLEIALVGGLGQRHGILVLAGTGSAVFGCSPDGQTLQLGGWGYLLDDEGSGYWIGLQALKHIIRDYEENYAEFVQYEPSSLNTIVLHHLGLNKPLDLIRWLYRDDTPPANHVAPLARLIVSEANDGNWDAINILQHAAIYLANKVSLMKRRLNYAEASIVFGGGLLDNDNRLSAELTGRIGLITPPVAKYPPVIGAALLAQLEWNDQHSS